jgi:hypothetical protein
VERSPDLAVELQRLVDLDFCFGPVARGNQVFRGQFTDGGFHGSTADFMP